MFLPITEEENELIKVKIFLILWLEVREARCPFQCVNSKQRFRSQDFRSKFPNIFTATRYILITTEATERHGNFNLLECDLSTWPARRKFDRSTSQSVQTLSVDRPLFRAPAEEQEKSVWSRISSTESRVSVVIGHLHDGVILLLRPESVGFLLSCTN